MYNGSSLYGGSKKGSVTVCPCASAPPTVSLMKGTCVMITSTQSDQLQCKYHLTYSTGAQSNHLSLDVLPSQLGANTGNAFPGTDGWVLCHFDPVPPVFPLSEEGEQWHTLLIPNMSEYLRSSQADFVGADIWTAMFHPEEAISLTHRGGPSPSVTAVFQHGSTWQLVKALRFPIPSI